MGRKKIQIAKISDERDRRVTFKKRRIGLLKKAIQLSTLTDCQIVLKVFNREDNSFIEYYSNDAKELEGIVKKSPNVNQYSKFSNSHYELVSRVEEKVTKHGHPNCSAEAEDLNFMMDLEQQIEGVNTMQLFSLTKKIHYVKKRPNPTDDQKIEDG